MRILVLAPVGRDSEILAAVLRKRNLQCVVARDIDEFTRFLAEGAGALLITEEVIRDFPSFRTLLAHIDKEPEWSDLPVIALVDPGATNDLFRRHEAALHTVNLSVIERPARSETISRAVLSALRARRRQYQVRDFLAERLRTQENLWRTQKLESIGVLAGGIAHDFNNLLTGIMGNASLLEASLEDCPEHTPFLNEILKSAERAAGLTSQLLAYSGRGKFIVEPVSLSAIIAETGQLIRTSVSGAVEIHYHLMRPLPRILGDRTQLQQIVMNLIINAAESIPAGTPGRVDVFTSATQIEAPAPDGQPNDAPDVAKLAPGPYICFEVVDTGSGMSPETLGSIFEPFFTTKFTGRGLGLAAVEGIVRGHKGHIEVASRLGEGTRFTILLPVTAVPNPPAAEPSAQTLQSEGGHILVVDDEEFVRELARSILVRLGYRVSFATDGQEALQRLADAPARDPIHLVVLDWTMPVMDGAQAFAAIQRDYPKLPVLISSGFGESHTRASFPRSQLAGFIQKPFTVTQLSASVGQMLRQSRARP